MEIEIRFFPLLLMVVGGTIGTNLGIRSIVSFSMILLMIYALIKVPYLLYNYLADFITSTTTLQETTTLSFILIILILLILFKMIIELVFEFLNPIDLSDFQNKALGLILGAAIGYLITI